MTGGSKGSFYNISDDRSEYGIYVERTYSQPEGILTITVADEAAHSADGKTNQSTKYTADFDYKPPFYEWSDNFSGQYTKATGAFSIKLRFSEPIKGFQREYLEVRGGVERQQP